MQANWYEKYLSSVNRDGILTIYSIPDFKIFKTLDGPYNKPLCFSPNSSYFSCVSHKDNQGLIYRFPSFQLIKAIDCPSYTMYTNFSKNEKYMEITRDNITTELYSIAGF